MERRKFQTSYVSCPCWTQAALDPPSFPDCTCSAPLDDGLEDVQRLTQTLWNVGPRDCRLRGSAALSYCGLFTVVVTADTGVALSGCQALL